MKNLFYDNFKPHKEFISLSKEFILSEGFTAKDIDNLVKEDFIEKILQYPAVTVKPMRLTE